MFTKRLHILKFLLLIMFLMLFYNINNAVAEFKENSPMQTNSKPYTRWWWFASEIQEQDIKVQLDWLKSNNFGGVEVAFIYPLNRMAKDTINYTPRFKWLSPEFSSAISYAKKYADSIGLGCDFTFGTLWPFGDIYVDREDASRIWEDTSFRQDIKASWDYPKVGYVLNHLDRKSFQRYANRLNLVFEDACKGSTSSLFCDSWEVETKTLWTKGLDKLFEKKFGYDITLSMDSLWIQGYERQRYDYFKLISELVLSEFYIPFIENCHKLKALARAQCMGAPVDIIKAYSLLDIPETEAMLYEPSFSSVVASAACFARKKIISSETFTCLYGWPREHLNEEQTADLKLVCDALFANGTNHIIWHGTPFNPAGIDTVRFYASVHVGKKGSLNSELSDFNSYMEKVSKYMKAGKTYSDVAVYLPLEDSWVAGEYPEELQMKWSWGQYELRYVRFAQELKAYHPLWINEYWLKNATLKDGILYSGDAEFKSLFVDVNYLDYDALLTVKDLAYKGFPICIKKPFKEPGYTLHKDYSDILKQILKLPNVSDDFEKINLSAPLIKSSLKFDYWCRVTENEYYIFFANPKTKEIKYPMKYGQSFCDADKETDIVLNAFGKSMNIRLNFKPYQSLLLKVNKDYSYSFIDINFIPKTPKVK